MESSMIPLGTTAPNFNLKDLKGELRTLESYSDSDVLVIIFMCNHCPYVQKIWSDVSELEKTYDERVQFIGINSNANPNYPEDAYEKMADYAAEYGQEFPYLYDEGQVAAKAYDAQCTPDIFLFDKERKLAYRGAFTGLASAIDDLLNGKAPQLEQKVSMGCSIKWMQ